MKHLQGIVSFIQTARSGSFTAAAARLDLTPAAVSKNVLRLEQQLGVRLFNRSTRQLRLSVEGEAFLKPAAAALQQLDDGVAQISGGSTTPMGRVRISCGVAFGRRYVLPLLPPLTRTYPGLDIELSLDNRAIDLVREGFDIGVRGAQQVDSSLVARSVAKLPLVLVASPTYLNKRGVPQAPADLAAHDLLAVRLSDGGIIEWRVRSGSRGFINWPVQARLWVSDPEVLLDPALAHAGIAQTGLHHAMPFLRSGRLKVVGQAWHDAGRREIVLHTPHRRHLAPRVRVVADALLQAWSRHVDLQARRDSLPVAMLA